MTENEIAKIVFESALKIHREMGPGLLESVYRNMLYHDLRQKDLFVEKSKTMPLQYKDLKIDAAYRIDMLISQKLIVEVKSVEALTELHVAQLRSHLKLSDYKLGMLINFNVKLIKHGVKRVSNPAHYKKDKEEAEKHEEEHVS